VVLIDPAPLKCIPLATSRGELESDAGVHRRAGMRGAAAYLMMHTIGADLSFLNATDEGDLGVRLAAREAEVGLTPFSERAVLEKHRELRATAHLMDLAARYQYRSHTPEGNQQSTPVWLALAAEREDFFMSNAGLTREEAGADTARLLGSISHEITLPGTHIEVCQRCMIGEVDSFTDMLRSALS